MIRALLLEVLLGFAASRASQAHQRNAELAPGVEMPLLNCGVSQRANWVKAGGRGIDTAWCYGDGDQKDAGGVVSSSGLDRSEFFVTTKIPCCPPGFGSSGRKSCAAWQSDVASIQHDFDMLGLEKIDLLLMHWPCERFEDTVSTYRHLEQAFTSGRVRAIGVSNFNASMIEALMASTSIKPAVNQVGFSIGGHAGSSTDFGSDDVTLAKCKELGITLSAYSPLGRVTGIDVLHHPQVLAVAAAHQKTAAQVALRWLVQQGIPAVTSTNSAQHAAEDLEVLDFELSSEEMDALSAITPEATPSPVITV